jgi:PAS domain S-box-containing protein
MAHLSLQSVADQIEATLRSAADGPVKARVRMSIQRLAVPALGSDDYGRFVVVNDAALQLTGYSESELLRLSVPDITAASDEPHTDVLWGAFLEHGRQSGTYDIRRKDGAIVAVEYLAIANVASGIHVSLLQPAPA